MVRDVANGSSSARRGFRLKSESATCFAAHTCNISPTGLVGEFLGAEGKPASEGQHDQERKTAPISVDSAMWAGESPQPSSARNV